MAEAGENPRLKLYKTLLSSKDPEVRGHFSKIKPEDFDKKLASDKSFQDDLFLDLQDLGMAKDSNEFYSQYVPKQAAAPAAAPAAPVAAAPAPGQEPDKKGFKIPDPTFGIIPGLVDVAKGVYQAGKSMFNVKSETSKNEEAQKKSLSPSASGLGGGNKDLYEYELASDEFVTADKKKKALEHKLGLDRKRAAGAAPTLREEAAQAFGIQPNKPDFSDWEQKKQKFEAARAKGTPAMAKIVNDLATQAVTKESDQAYITDSQGIKVPNQEYITKKAREAATRAGASEGGYVSNYINTTLKAALSVKQTEPETVALADKIFGQLNNFGPKSLKEMQNIATFPKAKQGPGFKEAAQQDFEKGVISAAEMSVQAKEAYRNAKTIADKDYKPKVKTATDAWTSALSKYKANMATDPDIKNFVADYDAKTLAPLQEAVNKGQMSVEQANKMYTSKEASDVREAAINEYINSSQHGKQIKKDYNLYLNEVSSLNTRYNARMRRQADEIEKIYTDRYNEIIALAKKNYNVPPHMIEKYKQAYEMAYSQVMKKNASKREAIDIDAGIFDNFLRTTFKGLGEGIQSTAFAVGLEDASEFGRLLADNFQTSDLNINSWSDVGFGNAKDRTKFAMSAGNILGRMAPGLAASGAIAAATGGAGLGLLPSMLLAAVPSAAFETADIMGSVGQQVLSQTGDIAKAQQAESKALDGQLKIWPTYLLDGLPFFSRVLKGIKPFRSGLANSIVRGGVATGIELVTETAQEVPQNVFEEVIVAGKDPTFAELYNNITLEKIKNTSASVASISILMGGAPQVITGGKDAIAKQAARGYYAKQILNQASHPALVTQNQAQFLTQLAEQRSPRFAAQMVNVLLQKGNIDKAQAEVLAKKLENYQIFVDSMKANKNPIVTMGLENPVVKQAAFLLFDRFLQARNSKNPEAEQKALDAYNRFLIQGKGADLVMLRMPSGDFNVYTYEDFNSLMDDKDFQEASRMGDQTYSGVFEIVPFAQSQEQLNDPRLKQILDRFDIIKNAEPAVDPADEAEETTADTEEEKDIDERILEGQQRTGFVVESPLARVPQEYMSVVDAVMNQQQGVTMEDIEQTMRHLDNLYRTYDSMPNLSARNLTIEQINQAKDELENVLTELNRYAANMSFDDQDAAADQEAAAEEESQQAAMPQMPTPEEVVADERAGQYSNLIFDASQPLPDYLQQYAGRSVRFMKDGTEFIQLTVPASLAEFHNQTAEMQTPAAEEVAPESAPAPEAEPAPEEAPAPEAEPATQKPKAKIKLFSKEDVVGSFAQKQLDQYNEYLFDGNVEAAEGMVERQRGRLIAKEITLVETGTISDKVKQSFKLAGIDIAMMSTDDFVKALKEAGATVNRLQEGIFDDKNGKIYVNKDVLTLGWGTTVVWHEAIHPIMNIIHNSNKPLYDKIYKGILAGAKANPEGKLAAVVEWANDNYTEADGYDDLDRKDEMIVETLARLSSGRMSFSDLQPGLRQRFIDLINRMARILGFSNVEVSDMKAIKDLSKKITETIKEGRNLSEIVGEENIGKFQRPGTMTANMAASLSRETQAKVVPGQSVGTRKPSAKKSPDLAYNKDLLIGLEATKANPILYKFNAMLVASYDIMYPVLPPTIKTYLNGIYKTLNKYQNEVETLRDEIDADKKEIVNITIKQEKLKKTEAAKLTTRIIAGEVKRGGYGRLITDLRKKIDRLEQLTQKDGLLSKERERVRKEIENYAKDKMTMQMADRIYKEFIGITQSNLEALVDLFPERLREVAKLWYDGANLIAQGFAKSYKTSIEQAAAVLAVFSPQKDWFMNISLAERLMNIYNNMMDYKFDDAMASKYLKRAGEPELTIDEKTGEEKWTGGAVPLLDEDGEHVEIDGVLQFKNWDNEKAKARIDDAAKILKSLRGMSLRELLDAGQIDKAARFVRMYSEVYDSPNFSFYTPDGRKGYEGRSEKGTLRKIAWGGYNTIEKALKIMEASGKNKMEVIHNELGEMHKVRSFYNNIADPLSKSGHVTMDTHAIAAILWKGLSGNSFEVTQNFGGAGTKSEAAIGSNGLYPVFAEAYREAANNLGYLPREIQSITWEAVRMLFKAKWKGNKENVKKINNIWANFRNGELTIEQAREQIWKLATAGARGTIEEAIRNGEGVGSPDWAEILDSGLDPERVRKANDAVRLSMAGGVRYDGERGVGRRRDVAGAAGVVPGSTEGGKPGSLELKPQASRGGRDQMENTPLGVSKKPENISAQDKDVITSKISVAPFYSVKVKTIEEANAVFSSPAFIRYKKDVQEFAKAAGIKIINIEEGIGGFQFDDGTAVKEATTVLEVNGEWQNIVDFTALIGALTPEVQEATIAGRFVKAETKEHNADLYSYQIDNTEAALQAAADAGFDLDGFTLLNDEIRFINPFYEEEGKVKFLIEDIDKKINTFVGKYKEYGGSIQGKDKEPVQSEYIDYEKRADALGRIAADALQRESRWAGLRDRIIFAEKRNKAFQDWKEVKKSEEASEYTDLRREQIEAGSRGEVLSDEKLSRIKELEKVFETPLTTVVSTDKDKYEEAKAEIDAIANDVAKMVPGGFSSPFGIKRPARAAIKVVRWYSLNPNMLGDGSRVNVIVNTDTDADYLFDQIRDRFTIPGDRVEYDNPTGLGYPKRLIEIRTSNGKIAEIQVMTPQGYLAKDGVKYFPKDKQDLAREALSEVQERLGWNIPDGVGHYFYEIERDTNVQNNLRKEAIRVSNLYYEAFLEPKSTLSDSEFRKAISDFKDMVDSADKTKWDETNKGEAPAELVEYLGEKPQASKGGRPEAPSFSDLDEILDMSPVKGRAARSALVDEYGKETVDRMIEISRNFTKIINGLEEQGVVEKDCP